MAVTRAIVPGTPGELLTRALKPGVKYPEPYITTNTEDDRVHPGHPRKFAAELKALLKKLSVVRTDMIVLDTLKGTIYAHSDELRILVSHPELVAPSDKAGVIQFNGRKLSSAISRLSGILSVDAHAKGLKVTSAKTSFELEAQVPKARTHFGSAICS